MVTETSGGSRLMAGCNISKTDSLKSIFDVVQWATIKFATFLTGKHIIFISLNHVFGNAPFPHVGCKAKGTYWSNLRKRD